MVSFAAISYRQKNKGKVLEASHTAWLIERNQSQGEDIYPLENQDEAEFLL